MASNFHGNCSNNNHAKRNHSSRTTCTSSSGRAYQEPFAMQNTTKEERPMSEFGTTPLKDEALLSGLYAWEVNHCQGYDRSKAGYMPKNDIT